MASKGGTGHPTPGLQVREPRALSNWASDTSEYLAFDQKTHLPTAKGETFR